MTSHAIELNRGWVSLPYGFGKLSLDEPSAAAAGLLWPSSHFKLLLNFHWVESLSQFRNGPHAFLGRAEGVLNLGGVWDLVAINPFAIEATERDLHLLQLATGERELGAAGHLHLRVHTGAHWDESLLRVELLNPFTYEREVLGKSQFAELTHTIINLIADAVAELPAPLLAAKRERYFYADGLESELASMALLLASYFPERRVPYGTLVKLLLSLELSATYRCLSELPEDGSMGAVAASRLAKLYA